MTTYSDVREVFRDAPQAPRERRRADRLAADGGLAPRLPVEPPYDWGAGGGLECAFPAPDVVASARGVPAPVRRFAAAVAAGTVRLDGSTGLAELVASLTAVPGVGAEAAHHLAMRLGERDAFPAGARRSWRRSPLTRRRSRRSGARGAPWPPPTCSPMSLRRPAGPRL